MQKLSRREALRGTGVAALAAGVAVVPFVAIAMPVIPRPEGGGELAALVQRYFREVDRYNATVLSTDLTEPEADLLAKVYESFERKLLRTPVRTADDALALLDYMERENLIESYHGSFRGLVEKSVKSLRTYIAGARRGAPSRHCQFVPTPSVARNKRAWSPLYRRASWREAYSSRQWQPCRDP